jgi:hypothetical protein
MESRRLDRERKDFPLLVDGAPSAELSKPRRQIYR